MHPKNLNGNKIFTAQGCLKKEETPSLTWRSNGVPSTYRFLPTFVELGLCPFILLDDAVETKWEQAHF